MTRFNTGNPINSLAEEDFYDNCLSLDQAMNSTEPTWRDRFNVEKPTIDAALKSAGFMPAGFDFVTGGTLQPGDRNKAVYNPAPNGDNNWYRWNGVFPKEIAANSQPNPKGENNWVLAHFRIGIVEKEALRRTYLEAGYNLVNGSFEQGGTLVNSNDVLLQERTGKAFSGPVGVVAAGTNPTLPGSGYVSRTDVLLRNELAAAGGAGLVGYSFNGVANSVRTVLSKLRDSAANIEDFGAVGDGKADDTAAFATANILLQNDSYLALTAGKNYKISGFTFTKRISVGCPNGRASITSETGLSWLIGSGDLDITVENINFFPRLAPNIADKTTALRLEVTSKNYGSGGFAVIKGVKVESGSSSGFYQGVEVVNQAVIIDGCDVILRKSHDNPAARDGSIANWEVNSGDGILLNGATYSFLRNCKVYYAMNAYRCVGQIEEVHMNGCMALINRKCFVFESLVGPANQHRINNCHGVTYLRGIEMAANFARIVLCSIESSSIFAMSDATASRIIFANVCLDGANINNFQAFNSGSRGANDIAVYLATAGGTASRRVMVSGLHCRGVGTGVYLDSNERNYIADVSMLQANMVGPAPKVYAYGPNNTSSPVDIAYGFPEQENVLPAPVLAPVLRATGSIGLKKPNTVGELGADRLLIREVGGNFTIESADASGVLQRNAGIDQSGTFRSKWLYPLEDATYKLGNGSLRWDTVFATTGAINTSDAREKTAPLPIDDAVLDAWSDVQLITFQWLDAIRAKGEDIARWHFGVIAQQVRDTFIAHHLDGCDYGLLCYDEWGDEFEPIIDVRKNPETDALEEYETGELRQTQVAGNRWGIRADQCLFLEAAYQRRRCDRIEARLSAAGL